MTTTAAPPVRSRADIEAEIRSKRKERDLYVSAEGVAKCHAAIDALLDEWALWPVAQHLRARRAAGHGKPVPGWNEKVDPV